MSVTTDHQRAIITAASTLLRDELALIRSLTGGQHATTLLVAGDTSRYVVRAFPPGDDAAAREASVLTRVRSLDALVPRLVVHTQDPDLPIIVTSAIPGTPPEPGLPARTIASQMAAALARIHRLDGTGLRRAPARPPGGDSDIAVRARREWGDLDLSGTVLTHYDFWCGNALWDTGHLTGIVDWSGARNAPRGVDVAWCRLDLVLLGSIDAAKHFLTAYERNTGRSLCDISSWDLQAAAQATSAVESWAPNYHGIGRTDLTSDILRQRLDAWVATL
jgi:aminoglycoside phosphotransferase (APT) family kinase protein